MNELKPCPFCGSEKIKLLKIRANWGYGYHVTCKACRCTGPVGYSDKIGLRTDSPEEKEEKLKTYAITEWNRRENSPQTNGDRIRSMSNIELAVTLVCPNEMGLAEIECDHSDGKNCCKCLLDWLDQPENSL